MRKLLLLLALAPSLWGAYAYKATITLAQTTGSSDLTNRTNIVYMSDASLKLVANGGQIQHACTQSGQTVPCDLIFTSDSGGTTKLNWGIESYDGLSAGTVWAHVKKTTSHSGTTVIYAFWGNSAVSTWQGGAVGSEFDSYTVAMIPFTGLSATPGSIIDFSSLQNNTTADSLSNTSGVVDGAGSTSYGATFQSFPANSAYSITAGTISEWVNPSSGMCAGSQSYDWYTNLFARNGDVYSVTGVLFGCSGLNGYLAVQTSSGNYYSPSVISTGTWTHVALAFANGQTSTFYVNGVASGTFTPTITSPGNSSFNLHQGGNHTQSISLSYDQFYMSNVMRSADWIAADYNNAHAPATFATVSGIGVCSGNCGASATAVTLTPIIM